MERDISRRLFIRKTTIVSSIGFFAGCGGSNGGDGGGDAPAAVEDHMNDAKNYDGVIDETGIDEITVTVGPNGNNSYDPAAVRISSGTTIVWEWDTGQHNVAVEDAPTNWSGHEAIEEPDFTYEHTFDEAGEYLYFCTPHEELGMKGAVVVE